MDFYKKAKKAGIKPIIGCEFYIVQDDLLGVQTKEARSSSYHLTVLALSKEGYHNLVAWNSFAMRSDNFYYRPRISITKIVEEAPYPLHHNVFLSGCLAGELCKSLTEGGGVNAATFYVRTLKSLFSNFYIELQNHKIEKYLGKGFETYEGLIETEENLRPLLISIAELTNTPIVVTNDSHLQWAGQRKAHIAMKASGWRYRDDQHYSESQEKIIVKYLSSYAYFGNYLRGSHKYLKFCLSSIKQNQVGCFIYKRCGSIPLSE